MKVPVHLLFALSTLLLAGCAGYKLGPSNGLSPGEKSVLVNPFENKTYEPFLSDAITSQLRKEVTRDGTYKLSSRPNADIVVSGTLVDFNRREVSVSSRDTLTVRDFRLSLAAQVTAMDRVNGRMLLNQRVMGSTLIRADRDLASSERQALPLLAADLARNITSLLADGSW